MSENKLAKKMTFWHIWALGVGAVVGDGIFLMVGEGAMAAGPAASVSYLVGGLLIMVACLVISEMAVGMPGAGSLHTWSKRMLGPVWGTMAGLCEVVMNIVFLGSVSLAAGAITNYFLMIGNNPSISMVIWAIIWLSIILIVALRGGEVTGRAQLFLVIILASIMLAFAVIGLVSGRINPANYEPFAPFGTKGMWIALGMGIYAYMGPLSILTAGDEVKKITDLPKAMFWAFVTFLILYTTAIVVMVGLVPYNEYASMESPFTTAATLVFGNAAGFIMNFAAWIAAITCLVGEIFCASRLLFGMANDGVVPKKFASISKKQVPWFGLVFAYVIAVIFVLTSLISALDNFYVMLAMIGCVAGTVCMLISIISSMRYKSLFPEEYAALPWKLPAKNLMVVIAFIGVAAIFYSIFSGDPGLLIPSAVFLLLIVAFFYLYSNKNMKKVSEDVKIPQ